MTAATEMPAANLIIMQTYAAFREALPEDADKTALDAIVANPIQPLRIADWIEFGFAKREHLSADLAASVADAGHCAVFYGFNGLGANGRGAAIETLLRGGKLPKGVDEPAVDPRWAPAPPPPQFMPLPPAQGTA